jgi:hypothetical protein
MVKLLIGTKKKLGEMVAIHNMCNKLIIYISLSKHYKVQYTEYFIIYCHNGIVNNDSKILCFINHKAMII